MRAAVDALLNGKHFDNARQLAASQAPNLVRYVEDAHKAHLKDGGHLDDLSNVDGDAAIELCVAKGDWDKVFELAGKQGVGVVQRYATNYAALLVKDQKIVKACEVFVKHGAPCVPANYKLYRRIALELLSGGNEHDSRLMRATVDRPIVELPLGHKALHDVMTKLVDTLQSVDSDSPSTHEFIRFRDAAHYSCMRVNAWKEGLKTVSMMAAVTLLRFTDLLPVDKAFFDAGTHAKHAGADAMAFVFLNRFVDLGDLIADPESGDIDNSDFMTTDVPSPFDVTLPDKHNYTEDAREEVRSWVLERAMDNAVGASLTATSCEKCKKQIFEGAIKCVHCDHAHEYCAVTGYPVKQGGSRGVQCKSCRRPARRDEWNKYIVKAKACPCCSALQGPSY
jgi:intraflagellar transport protein 172